MAATPLDTISNAPMRFRQYVMVALCCLINITDGYDVVSLAYAAPVLLREWGTPPEMLGLVFSAASLGLAIGAFFLAPLCDRVGRRPMMLAALIGISVAHGFSAIATSIWELMTLRFLIGLCLGLLVVSLNVMVSEYSNDRQRSTLLAVLHSGFTVGMMLGGLLAALVLEPYGWRAIFVAGAAINMLLLVLLLFFMWESPTFLVSRQPRGALARMNRILGKLGHAQIDELPQRPPEARRGAGIMALLAPSERRMNLLFWGASLSYAVIGYFLLNWKPKVLVDAGLTPTEASLVGATVGIMGVIGHLAIGVLARKWDSRTLTAVFFAMLGVCLVIFGNVSSPVPLIASVGMLQFFTVGAYTGLFLTAVTLYPPERRTIGIGFMVGFGRVGAIFGPFLGGVLLGTDLGRSATFAIFAMISAVPVIAMILLSRGMARRTETPATAAV